MAISIYRPMQNAQILRHLLLLNRFNPQKWVVVAIFVSDLRFRSKNTKVLTWLVLATQLDKIIRLQFKVLKNNNVIELNRIVTI